MKHELYGILEEVGRAQDEDPLMVEFDDYPEKYHVLILAWLNGEITPKQAVIKAME